MLDLQAISEHARKTAEAQARRMWRPDQTEQIERETRRIFHKIYWQMVSPHPAASRNNPA